MDSHRQGEPMDENQPPKIDKESVIKSIIAILVFSGSCISVGLYADDRYVKRNEFLTFIMQSDKAVPMAADILRKQLLEDKIFELDLVPDNQKTDIQRAMANRARAQLQDVQNRVSQQGIK
jgi:hypothetical protein